ncbi:MAG: glycosyltransferase family 2 protein [Ruminococcaceae bacterium]|nr:glycosyltransferase family 2 protein [Oscillospiraceae bacterium]
MWLSIIIPAYNAENYIARCIKSILKQTFKDYELIIVNDGSTDRTEEICDFYATQDSRIKLYNTDNHGCLAARVFGISQSNGKYILNCDADDRYFSKKAFETLYQYAKSDKYQLIQFGHYNKYHHLGVRRSVKSPICIQNEEFMDKEYPRLLGSYERAIINNSVWNKLYSRELITALPNTSDVGRTFWGDDNIVNLYLLSDCNSVYIVPDIIYMHYSNTGGTNQYRDDAMQNLNIKKLQQLDFLEQYTGNKDKQCILSDTYTEIAGWLYHFAKETFSIKPKEEALIIIQDALELPTFIMAREYFNNSTDNWIQTRLLCSGDAHKYYNYFCENSNYERRSTKSDIIEMLKRLYKFI